MTDNTEIVVTTSVVAIVIICGIIGIIGNWRISK